MICILNKNYERAEYLIEYGADINMIINGSDLFNIVLLSRIFLKKVAI